MTPGHDPKERASLDILPPTRQVNGETSAETVLLRLITERGRPSVKIAASEQAAGISLAGPAAVAYRLRAPRINLVEWS